MLENDTVSISEAQRQIGVPDEIMRALLFSGCLGYCENGRLEKIAVEHFRLYGTQWRNELGKRDFQNLYREYPRPKSNDAAPSTPVHIRVMSANNKGFDPEDDEGWIAHFYLKTNYFFPHPIGAEGGLNRGSTGVSLASSWKVEGVDRQTILYNDPSGELAMVAVIGEPIAPTDDPFRDAYDIVTPLLDELSLQYDHPLNVVQYLVIGVPSGVIDIWFPIPSDRNRTIDCSSLLPRSPHPELAHASTFYREGICGDNPFFQFLSLWKAYESAVSARNTWRQTRYGRRSDSRFDVVVEAEVFPDKRVFGLLRGKSFGEAREELRGPYRNAIAHGAAIEGEVKAGTSGKTYLDVLTNVPIIRFMARTTIVNARACLSAP